MVSLIIDSYCDCVRTSEGTRSGGLKSWSTVLYSCCLYIDFASTWMPRLLALDAYEVQLYVGINVLYQIYTEVDNSISFQIVKANLRRKIMGPLPS